MNQERTEVEVSIVIAAFNAAMTIRPALASALSQTYQSLEVIVCDDASTDETATIVASINHPRLKLIRNRENQGPGYSRDKAIEHAAGRWVAFMDADDILDSHRIEYLMQYCSSHPDFIVFDDIEECHHTHEGLVPFKRVHGVNAFFPDVPSEEPREVTLSQLVRSRRLLVKPIIPVDLIKQHGVKHLPLRYGEDGAFLWTLIARGSSVLYVPVPLYRYRITPGSASVNPQRYFLLAQCFESVLNEALTPEDHIAIEKRARHCREFAEFKSRRQAGFLGGWLIALRYFARDPRRIINIAKSIRGRFKYHRDRIRSGGVSRL